VPRSRRWPMWGALWWDFLTCCTTRDREGDHLLPAVPPDPTKQSDSGRGDLDRQSTLAVTPSGSRFWGSYWVTSESKAQQKDELDNHVGLKEVSSTHSQIYLLKEQMRLLQRQNEQLMNNTLPAQPTYDTQDADLPLLKNQLIELRNRNAQLEDELGSQGSSHSTTHRRPPKAQRVLNTSVTPPRRGSSAPNVNLAAAAAQVARNRFLKNSESSEDGKTRIDLTSIRPVNPRLLTSVRKSTAESEVCDLTGLREQQSVLLGSPSRQ